MTDHNLDPFALGGSEDAAIRSLFRQWLDGHRAAQSIVDETENGDALTAANDQLDELTRQIDGIPARGAAGLAIKSYLALHSELYAFVAGDDSAGLRRLEHSPHRGHSIVAMLRDAARFVPEIAAFIPQEADHQAEAVDHNQGGESIAAQIDREAADRLFAEWLSNRAQYISPEIDWRERDENAHGDRLDELARLITTTPAVLPWMIMRKIEVLEYYLCGVDGTSWSDNREVVMLGGIKADLLRFGPGAGGSA